jgi:hypothetical protein
MKQVVLRQRLTPGLGLIDEQSLGNVILAGGSIYFHLGVAQASLGTMPMPRNTNLQRER